MSLGPVVRHALGFGLILCAVLFPLLLVLVRINPELMPNDCPRTVGRAT